MKPVLLALLIFIVNSVSFAQIDSNLIAQSSYSSKPSPLFVQPVAPFKMEILPPGYRMRRVGSTLTLAGTFLVIGGVIVHNNIARTTTPSYYGSQPSKEKFDVGPVMIVGGVGMIVPGIIFWVKGASKYKHFLAEEENNTASLRFTGNGVVYRFR